MDKGFKISLLISVIILLLAIVFVIFKRPVELQETVSPEVDTNFLTNDYFLGQNEAEPFVVFEDPQCPFCKKFFDEVEPQIYENFVKTGKIKLIVKVLPILGEESILAAKAMWCAGNQGKFWEFREIVFANQRGENLGAFKKEKLINFAQQLNLNLDVFSNCLLQSEGDEKIKNNRNLMRQLKIGGTPSFWYKNKVYVGFMSYDKIKDIIQ